MKRISSMILGACLWAAGCSDSPLAPTAAPETSEQNATPKVAFNTAPSQTSASVTTDKEDYQPGDTVVITGTGWAADETVDLVVDEEPETHAPHNFTSVADAAGSFVNRDLVIDEHDVGVTFTLTATGRTSGLTATAVFTDGTIAFTSFTFYPGGSTTGSPASGCSGSPGTSVQLGTQICALASFTISGTGSTPASIRFRNPSGTVAATVVRSSNFPSGTSGAQTFAAAFTPTVAGNNWTALLCESNSTGGSTTGCQPGTIQRGSAQFEVTSPPANQPPTANAGGPYSGNEGAAIMLDGSGSSDSDGTIAGYQWSLGTFTTPSTGSCSFVSGTSTGVSPSVICTDNGSLTVSLTVTDDDGAASTPAQATVTVGNVAPTATFSAESPVDEGSTFLLELTSPFDPSSVDTAAGLQYAFDCGDGSGYNALSATTSRSCPTNDDGTRSVKGKIQDKDGGSTEYTASVTIDNVAPSVSAITGAPTDPIPLGTAVNVCAPFSDPGTADTHTGTIDFNQNLFNGGASIVKTATISFNTTTGNGQACASHTYAAAGVYAVKARVEDDDLGAGESPVYEYVVVYDPSAGFVTGGGWIWSPSGAYAADPSLEGKANFGFVSKYKKGVTVPEGQTQFQFHAGNLNFHSTSYDWLVVAGARAQYKGYGTINGTAGYGFLLTAIDGQVNGGGETDKFRIKIWDGSGVVYDNQMGASDDSNASTALGGGSIVIHSPKK